MNILQMEDMVKGLPDDQLFQEAQAPTGQIPQFLTFSEIQRRTDMRERFAAQQKEQPQSTIAEQVMQKGIASSQPQTSPQQQPQAAPMGMAGGGIVSMWGGGVAPRMSGDWWDRENVGMGRRWENLEKERIRALRDEEKSAYEAALPSIMADPSSVLPNFSRSALGPQNPFKMPGYRGSADVQGGSDAQQQGLSAAAMSERAGILALAGIGAPGAAASGYGGRDFISELAGELNNNTVDVANVRPTQEKMEALIPEMQKYYSGRADAQRAGYESLDDLVKAQNQDAWAGALVSLGAGIAGDDLDRGLREAGIAGLAGKRDARELQMMDRAARQQNEAIARGFEDRGFEAGMGIRGDVIGLGMEEETARAAARNTERDNRVSILSQAAQAQIMKAHYEMQSLADRGIREGELARIANIRITEAMESLKTDPEYLKATSEGKMMMRDEIIRSMTVGIPWLAEALLGKSGAPAAGPAAGEVSYLDVNY